MNVEMPSPRLRLLIDSIVRMSGHFSTAANRPAYSMPCSILLESQNIRRRYFDLRRRRNDPRHRRLPERAIDTVEDDDTPKNEIAALPEYGTSAFCTLTERAALARASVIIEWPIGSTNGYFLGSRACFGDGEFIETLKDFLAFHLVNPAKFS